MRKALWITSIVLSIVVVASCGGAQGTADIKPGKMPPGGNFDGVFQSPAYGRMEFTVDKGRVMGLYEGERHYGRIEGNIEGNLLFFHWTQWNEDMQGKVRESSGRGYFKYLVEVEGGATTTREVHQIKGEWGYGENETGNPWKAIKLSSRSKKRLKPYNPNTAGEGSDEHDYGASGFDEVAGEEEETSVQMSEPEEEKEEEDEGGVDDLFD